MPLRRKRATALSGYAGSTHSSPHWVVRYPHQARFAAALDELRSANVDSVLDYGAGDAYLFLKLFEDGGPVPGRLVAYEPVPHYAQMARDLLATNPAAERAVQVVEDLEELGDEQFDLITCMSVLEHMPLPERRRFYGLAERLLKPSGSVLVEVPIELGPSLLVKELGRVVLKRRPPEHGFGHMLGLAAGRREFDPARFDPDSESTWIQDHAGFDYRLFAMEVAHRFRLERSYATPLGRLPAWLGNQEMFFVFRPLPPEKRLAMREAERASTTL